MVMLMNNKPFSLKVLGAGERSASLLKSSSSLNTYQSIMGPIADKSEGKIDTELAEENRVARANQNLVSNALEYQKYLYEREQSRREAVRIEREQRERFEDDERWKRLARHMEDYRNLLRSRSRPG
jgi:hypothetical protein